MNERYFVVSESELREFLDYHAQGMRLEDADADVLRARPVPAWATHFARACPRNLEELVFDSSEEIKR